MSFEQQNHQAEPPADDLRQDELLTPQVINIFQLLRSSDPAQWQRAGEELESNISEDGWVMEGLMYQDYSESPEKRQILKEVVGRHMEQFEPALQAHINGFVTEAGESALYSASPAADFALQVATEHTSFFVGQLKDGYEILRAQGRHQARELVRAMRGAAAQCQGPILDMFSSSNPADIIAGIEAASGNPPVFIDALRSSLYSPIDGVAPAALAVAKANRQLFEEELLQMYAHNKHSPLGAGALAILGEAFPKYSDVVMGAAFANAEGPLDSVPDTAVSIIGAHLQEDVDGKYKALLLRKLRDSDSHVRKNALQALGSYDAEIEESIRSLASAETEKASDVRITALEIMSRNPVTFAADLRRIAATIDDPKLARRSSDYMYAFRAMRNSPEFFQADIKELFRKFVIESAYSEVIDRVRNTTMQGVMVTILKADVTRFADEIQYIIANPQKFSDHTQVTQPLTELVQTYLQKGAVPQAQIDYIFSGVIPPSNVDWQLLAMREAVSRTPQDYRTLVIQQATDGEPVVSDAAWGVIDTAPDVFSSNILQLKGSFVRRITERATAIANHWPKLLAA